MEKNYKEMFKAIKPYVNFKIDLRKKLTSNNKSLISRYYNQFLDINQGMNIKVFRTKNNKNLKLVQDSFHKTSSTLPKWKVAFVPYNTNTPPSIRVRGGKVYTYNPKSKLKSFIIPIDDKLAFISAPYEYTYNLLFNRNNVPPKTKMVVITGEYISSSIYEAEILPYEMELWVERYEESADFILGFKSVLYR